MIRMTIWFFHPTKEGALSYSTYIVNSYDVDSGFLFLKGDDTVHAMNLDTIHSFLATSIPPEEEREFCKNCDVDGKGKYCYLDCEKAMKEE